MSLPHQSPQNRAQLTAAAAGASSTVLRLLLLLRRRRRLTGDEIGTT